MTNPKCLSCHIIGFNPYAKKEFIDGLNNKIFNIVDLDIINQDILKDETLDKMYKQYQKLKEDKNDKFKEVDKKMSAFWETTFVDKINQKLHEKKMNILIGQNNHYKSLTKRVNIECTNKFLVQADIEQEVQSWIKYNLETYKDDIIKGMFPLEYINHDFLTKKRQNIEQTYKKIGYIEKSIEQLKTITNLIENSTKNTGKEMWIAMKEPYNVNSLIHPKPNDKITAFAEPAIALINSFNFTNDEIKKTFDGNELAIKEVKPQSLNKLKTRRFLYLLDGKTFIPHENGSNQKFFSQIPVKILAKEKINNVRDFFTGNYTDKK
jgi:hypothetical protein